MEFDKKETTSYLDGVPFTVGQKYCPPRAIPLPYCMSYQLPAELMSDVYEFGLENKVLAFCRAKEDAEERLKEETERRQKEQAEKTLQEEAANHTMEAAAPESDGGDVVKPSTSLWNSDTILQPQSQLPNFHVNGASVDSTVALKKINFSDFEIDTRSPFDYMELQTINDFEELNTVFQGMCKDQKEESVQHAASSISNEQRVENQSPDFPPAQNKNSNVPENDISNSETYSNGSSFLGYTLPTFKSFSKNGGGYLSYSSPTVSDLLPQEGSKRNSESFDVSSYPVLSQVPCITTLTGQTTSSNCVDTSSAICNPLRSSKSISDLTNIVPANHDYAYSKRSHTPPAKTYDMPYHGLDSSITFVKQAYDQNSNTAVNQQQRDLPDPYEELSNNERHIVDSIADMGFHRALVSRTVKHLGTDEKKVVEHLCQIQVLEESGYDKFEAEAALHLHDYDKNEAIKYLDLINQFQDLGFEKEAIKKALVKHKNDRDKVIDMLLS